jgi:hypothetical protein
MAVGALLCMHVAWGAAAAVGDPLAAALAELERSGL